MNYDQISQELEFVSKDTLHSRLFLDFALLPHMSTGERAIIEALWHKTSRHGRDEFVPLTHSSLVLDLEAKATPGYLPFWSLIDRTTFWRSKNSLISLGLVQCVSDTFRLSCYPADFLRNEGKLLRSLMDHENPMGESIAQTVGKGISSYIYYADSQGIMAENAEKQTQKIKPPMRGSGF